jgi:dienelactone hydrolase
LIEQTLDIATTAGQIETFVCHPERGGPHPAIIFMMDAPGIRGELRDRARRLATCGYCVLLPNLYIGCAEHDELAPLDMVEKLRALFVQSGNPGELERYPAVHHGFAFPQRWCYDKPAAQRHWERLLALYRRRLPQAVA